MTKTRGVGADEGGSIWPALVRCCWRNGARSPWLPLVRPSPPDVHSSTPMLSSFSLNFLATSRARMSVLQKTTARDFAILIPGAPAVSAFLACVRSSSASSANASLTSLTTVAARCPPVLPTKWVLRPGGSR